MNRTSSCFMLTAIDLNRHILTSSPVQFGCAWKRESDNDSLYILHVPRLLTHLAKKKHSNEMNVTKQQPALWGRGRTHTS